MKLLLVEDDADVRKYLYENFSQSYHILQAENGEIAWDILNKGEKIDFIISDVMMSVMDGIKFCKLVKQNIHFCHIPLILLTAKSTVGEQLTGLNTGADDYISKPFVFSVLRAKVQNILKGRQRAIRNYAANIEANPAQIASNGIDFGIYNETVVYFKLCFDQLGTTYIAFIFLSFLLLFLFDIENSKFYNKSILECPSFLLLFCNSFLIS